MRILYQTSRISPITNAVSSAADLHPALSSPSATPLRSGDTRESGRLGDAPLPMRRDRFAPRIELAFGDSASLRGIRAGAEGVFRRNAISRESPVHRRQVGGLEPTVAREHVCGPDVISTATVNGAREGARVEIMSVGCPQTAGRASRSGQVPDYLSRNSPRRVRATTRCQANHTCTRKQTHTHTGGGKGSDRTIEIRACGQPRRRGPFCEGTPRLPRPAPRIRQARTPTSRCRSSRRRSRRPS